MWSGFDETHIILKRVSGDAPPPCGMLLPWNMNYSTVNLQIYSTTRCLNACISEQLFLFFMLFKFNSFISGEKKICISVRDLNGKCCQEQRNKLPGSGSCVYFLSAFVQFYLWLWECFHSNPVSAFKCSCWRVCVRFSLVQRPHVCVCVCVGICGGVIL